MKFIKIGDASKQLGIGAQTLRKWVDEDRIPHRTMPSGHRLVDIDAYLEGKTKLEAETKKTGGEKIFYCRVSSAKQQDDLERQVKLAQEKYPQHEIVKDIGSGINWKRRGFKSILQRVMCGEVKEIVVFHRDRLCRFAFELVEFICNNNNTKLLVHDNEESTHKNLSSEEELAADLMAIVTIFSCRQMGKRRYFKPDERGKSKVQEDKNLSNSEPEETTSDLDE